MRGVLNHLLVASLILLAFLSPSPAEGDDSGAGADYPRVLVDSAGREVTVERPLERIVVFNSETVEVIRSLKAQEAIVGVGKYTREDTLFFPELSELPGVGSVWSPDVEAVLSLKPDAVFLYGTFQKSSCDDIQEALEAAGAGIVVLRFDCYRPESYEDEVEKIGFLLDREEEADLYLDFYKSCAEEVKEVVEELAPEERPKVYLESWTDYKSCSSTSGWGQKLELSGADNVFSDLSVEYPLVDAEAVIVEDPDCIVKLCGAGDLAFGGYGEKDASSMLTLQGDLLARAGWENITAVRNGDVYVLSNDVLGGAKYFIGVAYLVKLFHPDRFTEMDPQDIHRRYLSEFQGLDLDPAEDGVFLVPS